MRRNVPNGTAEASTSVWCGLRCLVSKEAPRFYTE